MDRPSILASILLFLVSTVPATAADSSAMLKCSAISDGVKRLSCFDDLAKIDQKIADREAEKRLVKSESKSTRWNRSVSQSKLDDSETVVLMNKSKSSVRNSFGKEATPTIVIRCLEGKTSIFINFDGLFVTDNSDYGKVTFRIDKNKPFVLSMNVSTDNKALGLWSGGASIPFIKKLMGADSLIAHFVPYNASPETLSFDIGGLDKEIAPVRSACKW